MVTSLSGQGADRSLTRVAGVLAVLTGCALVIFTLARVFSASPPAGPLTAALLAGAFLEIAIGAGLLARSRMAWAFAISLNSVLAVAGLLALPALIRGGVHGVLAASAVGGTLAIMALCVGAGDRL